MDRDEFARRLLGELGYDEERLSPPAPAALPPSSSPPAPTRTRDASAIFLAGVLLFFAGILALAYFSRHTVDRAVRPHESTASSEPRNEPSEPLAEPLQPKQEPELAPTNRVPPKHRRAEPISVDQRQETKTIQRDPRAQTLRAMLDQSKAAPGDGDRLARLRDGILSWATELTDRDARSSITRRAVASALTSDFSGLESCIVDLEKSARQ